MKIKFTDKTLNFCTELHDLMNGEEPPLFRIGLVKGKFWFAMEDKDKVQASDNVVFETEDLIIICDCDDHELLKGTIVDFELHGLSKRITFKDERFEGSVFIAGDLHPAYKDQDV